VHCNVTQRLRKLSEKCELDSSDLGQGPEVGFCEHGNEHSVCIKAGKLLDQRATFSFSRWTVLSGASYYHHYRYC
jgi:hypothetical protein